MARPLLPRFEHRCADPQLTAEPHAPHHPGRTHHRPLAVNLLQPPLQAMTLGQSVDQLAHHVLYVHPTLTEYSSRPYSICELITRYALVAGFSSTIFGRLTATRARREHRLQLPTAQRATYRPAS
ncbi:MAG: hypothetical protein ACJ72I_09010 [Pseudonocardiaceae bacterium]